MTVNTSLSEESLRVNSCRFIDRKTHKTLHSIRSINSELFMKIHDQLLTISVARYKTESSTIKPQRVSSFPQYDTDTAK